MSVAKYIWPSNAAPFTMITLNESEAEFSHFIVSRLASFIETAPRVAVYNNLHIYISMFSFRFTRVDKTEERSSLFPVVIFSKTITMNVTFVLRKFSSLLNNSLLTKNPICGLISRHIKFRG